VTDEPGLRPRSPNIVVGPVLVTVEPASTEKLAAVPKPTDAVAPSALLANSVVESDASRINAARSVLALARARGLRPAARESPLGDSDVRGTPRFMGVS
jgi:hypothetical protein